MEDLNQYVDAMLKDHRPHGLYDSRDRTWREPVYEAIEGLIPSTRARELAAQQIVDQRETIATRQANKLLREIGRTKELPLDWMDVGAHPISVGDQRVRLSDARAVDLRQWAVDERRDATQELAARAMACDGAEWIANEMVANGWSVVGDAGAQP